MSFFASFMHCKKKQGVGQRPTKKRTKQPLMAANSASLGNPAPSDAE
ncbi:MAG: hypothetical protein HFE79_09415 [Ruminiclostridium sp.]|nr:hypothetical protein [Ruminiclostridium sp.]